MSCEKIEELLCDEHSGDDYTEDYEGNCPVCTLLAEIERLKAENKKLIDLGRDE